MPGSHAVGYDACVDAARLLTWFRAHRRPFPWRTPFPRDPYLVLVSEVMLQQTQASRVAERLPALLARFPTVQALAAAPEEAVVAAFAGMGYYRRARLLHRAAQRIAACGFPRTAAELAALPGVGAYTAAAVAAFAFGALQPPVDANLCRVTARLLALPYPPGARALVAATRELAGSMAASCGTPELFEALMELGATVCTPKAPACSRCPLQEHCAARLAGTPAAFPLPKPQRARTFPSWVALWAENPAGQVLLERLKDPPLAGLWLPPLDRGEGEPEPRARQLARRLQLPQPVFSGSITHHITHRTIAVLVFRAPAPLSVRENHGHRWASVGEALPTSSLFAKMAQVVGRLGERA